MAEENFKKHHPKSEATALGNLYQKQKTYSLHTEKVNDHRRNRQ